MLLNISIFLSYMRCVVHVITTIESPMNCRVSVDDLGKICPKRGSNYKEIHGSLVSVPCFISVTSRV